MVLAAAAHDMQLCERFAAKVSQLAQDVGIQQGETVKNAACQLGGAGRYRLPRFKTGGLDFGAHVRRVDKAVIVRVNQEGTGLQRFGFGDKLGQVGDVLLFQHPLEQPQAHDVLQHPVAPFGTAFVGDVRGQRGIAGVGRFALKAHQRPGAG